MMPKTSKVTKKREGKTEVIGFKVTPKEKELIITNPEKMGMPVNQYARVSVLMSMAFEGNIDAMKIVFFGVRDGFKEALAAKLENMNIQLPEFT